MLQPDPREVGSAGQSGRVHLQCRCSQSLGCKFAWPGIARRQKTQRLWRFLPRRRACRRKRHGGDGPGGEVSVLAMKNLGRTSSHHRLIRMNRVDASTRFTRRGVRNATTGRTGCQSSCRTTRFASTILVGPSSQPPPLKRPRSRRLRRARGNRRHLSSESFPDDRAQRVLDWSVHRPRHTRIGPTGRMDEEPLFE